MRVELVGAPWPVGHVHPESDLETEVRRLIRVGDPVIVEELRRIVRADGGDVRRALG